MEVLDLATIEYEEALKIQEDLLHKRIKGEVQDTLIMAEHYPVISLGRIGRRENILNESFFAREATDIISSKRGGEITYHAPGQLVVYPVIDLSQKKKDIAFYIDFLEKVAVEALKKLGVPAKRSQRRGVWAGDKKIAFIGIAVKRWVTFHGIAINVNCDITPFSHINPCGESDIRVTSMKEELGREIQMTEVKDIFAREFEEKLELEYTSLAALA